MELMSHYGQLENSTSPGGDTASRYSAGTPLGRQARRSLPSVQTLQSTKAAADEQKPKQQRRRQSLNTTPAQKPKGATGRSPGGGLPKNLEKYVHFF